MVSHPKVPLGLSGWKSWSAKPRFELVTPGADVAQAWGSCRDTGGPAGTPGSAASLPNPPFLIAHPTGTRSPDRRAAAQLYRVQSFFRSVALHEQLRGCCALYLIS